MGKNKEIATSFFEVGPLFIKLLKSEIRAVAKGDLTQPQYRILALIHRGLDTVSQLALHLGVSQPAMSKMVDMLVKRGLLCRQEDPRDRRQSRLALSSQGLKDYRILRQAGVQRLGRQIESLSVEERKKLERALHDLDHCLNQILLLNEEDL